MRTTTDAHSKTKTLQKSLKVSFNVIFQDYLGNSTQETHIYKRL